MVRMWVLLTGNGGDRCDLVTNLCNDLRKGDLFVLSWARVRQVKQGRISSELILCGGAVRSILLLPLVARCLETIYVYIYMLHVCFHVCCSDCGNVCCVGELLKKVGSR